MYLAPNELRAIIKGKTIFKPCPDCQGKGIVYFKWDSVNQESSVNISQDAYDNRPINEETDWMLYGEEGCETCERVGYVISIDGSNEENL